MKRYKGVKFISLLLLLALTASALAGCGSKSGNGGGQMLAKADTNTVYEEMPSPLADLLDAAEAEAETKEAAEDDMGVGRYNFVSTAVLNDSFYVLYTDMQSENGTCLCAFDKEGKKSRTILLPVVEDGGITHFCMMPDGSIVVMLNSYDEKKEKFIWELRCLAEEKSADKDTAAKDTAAKDSAAADTAAKESGAGQSAAGDAAAGAEDKILLKEVWKKTISENEDFYPSGIIATEKEIYVMTESGILVYDSKNGKGIRKTDLPSEDFYGNICMSPEGKIILVGIEGENLVAYTPGEEEGKYEKVKYEKPAFYFVDTVASGSGDYDFYAAKTDGIFGYKLDAPNPVKIIDFMASDLEIENAAGCAFMPDGTMVLLYFTLDYATGAGLFKKADPAKQGNKTVLSIGCTYADADLSKAIVSFNKQSDRYRIVLLEYPYDDEGNSTLNMEVASGNVPDMLCVTGDMPVESYAAKGLFEDLGPLFSEDPELSANEYLDNVLDAFRIDGKMYFISPSFNVIGLFGKKKDFGDTKGVTTAQIEKMVKERSLDYDTVMGLASRESILSWVMFCAMEEYVDWDEGRCSFGSESFVNLLKFCDKFPKTINYENINWAKYDSAMREGKQLLRDGYLYDFNGYMMERYGYIGEELSFMGYPGNGENGPVAQNELAVAISHNTADLEGCWEFLRRFYLDDYQDSIENAFPVSKKALQKRADTAMHPKMFTYMNEQGEEVSVPENGIIYINDKEISIPVPSQEDIDWVMNILTSLDTKASIDSKISEIVNEESGAFFAGQKGAEETADIIQSRVRVYISETK